MQELQELAKRKDIRSADRAQIRNFVKKLHKGHELSYAERQNMWAYITRYRGQAK
jgi:hypothetical protein